MNKMKKLYITWGVLAVLLIGFLTFLGLSYKTKLKPYKDMEEKLIEATEKYVELKFLYPEMGEVIKINSSDLISNNLIDEFSYENKPCEGYVKISYNGVYNYKSFIKCGDYKTKGY